MKSREQAVRRLSYAFLIVSSLIMVYPVLYIVLGAFTTPDRLIETVFLPIPNTLNLCTIQEALDQGVWDAYVFTFLRCAFYLTVTLVVGVMGGYIFSKLRFPGRDKVFLLLLSGMVMPAILMILPNYIMMARLPLVGGNDIFGQGGHGLIYDWPVLFTFGWVPPFSIFLFRQSFDMLPTEYEDAAKLDGAGILAIIFRVYGPLLKPPLAAITVVTFLFVWNDYLWPSVTILESSQYLPIGMRIKAIVAPFSSSTGGSPAPIALMRILLGLWPPALVYFWLQRYFVQGLLASGIQGAGLEQLAATQNEPDVEQQIIDLERRWAAAIQRQDAAAMQTILADNYVLVVAVQGQPLKVVARAPLLETQPGYRVESFSIDDIRVIEHGGLAVAVMLYSQKATAQGQDYSAQYLITDSWIKTPGGWRVAERHSSRPEQPAAAQSPSG